MATHSHSSENDEHRRRQLKDSLSETFGREALPDEVEAVDEVLEPIADRRETIGELRGLLSNTLDCETAIHDTLNFLLRRIGSSNILFAMPDDSDDYMLAGCVRYTCSCPPESLHEKLEAADTHEKISSLAGAELIGRNDTDRREELFGGSHDLLNLLSGSDILVAPVPPGKEEERRPVIVLFDERSYGRQAVKTLDDLMVVLGDKLEQLNRVNDRQIDLLDQEEGSVHDD